LIVRISSQAIVKADATAPGVVMSSVVTRLAGLRCPVTPRTRASIAQLGMTTFKHTKKAVTSVITAGVKMGDSLGTAVRSRTQEVFVKRT